MKRKSRVFLLCVFFLFGLNSTVSVAQQSTIFSPDKGEIWKSGEEREIKWLATPSVAKVNILYLINNGIEKIEVIAESRENTGSFIWKIPQKHALVRLIIKGYNAQGVLEAKVISEPFEIAPTIDQKARQISIEQKTKVAEIDVSDQKMRVYDSGVLIFEALLSTGRGEGTPTGIFTVCNKGDSDRLSSAWSKRYRCWMPYWVGLKDVPNKPPGRYGIHGPPYTKTRNGRRFKSTPWGRPSSKGCIRQFWDPSNPDSPNKAKEFFELVYIGMTVVIQK